MVNEKYSLNRLRIWTLSIPPCLFLIYLIPAVILYSKTPEPMAIHWGLTGTPNGTADKLVFAITTLLVILIFGVAAVTTTTIAVKRNRQISSSANSSDTTSFYLIPFHWIMTFLTATVSLSALSTVIVNYNQPNWHLVKFPFLALLAMLMVPVITASTSTYGITKLLPTSTAVSVDNVTDNQQPSSTALDINLASGKKAVWYGSAVNSVMRIVTVLFLILFGMAVTVGQLSAIPLSLIIPLTLSSALLAVAFSFFTSIQVSITQREVTVAYGVWRYPKTHIPIERINHAESIFVNPLQWGGWGYRGSLKLMKRAAIVLRKGEGIKLYLKNNSVIVITVDGSVQAAQVVNSIVGRF